MPSIGKDRKSVKSKIEKKVSEFDKKLVEWRKEQELSSNLVREYREYGNLENWIRDRCDGARQETVYKVKKSSRKRRMVEVAVWREVGRRCDKGCDGLECLLSFVSVSKKAVRDDLGRVGIVDNTVNKLYKENARKVEYKCKKFGKLNNEANIMIDEELGRACKYWGYDRLKEYVYLRDFEMINDMAAKLDFSGEEKKECERCFRKTDNGKDIINIIDIETGEEEELYVCDKCWDELKKKYKNEVRLVGELVKERKVDTRERVVIRKKIEIRKGVYVSEKGRVCCGDSLKEESVRGFYRVYERKNMKWELHTFKLILGGI